MAPRFTDDDLSRRQFIGGAAMTTAGVATGLSYFFSKDNVPKPERETVKSGFIGVGSRGKALLRAMLKVPGSEVVAVCDKIDANMNATAETIQTAAKAAGKPKAEVFKSDNYLDIIRHPDVEAVVIATPHYLHGPMAIAALEEGKHVYCEKAMAFTIGECRDIQRLVQQREYDPGEPSKRTQVFQVGHQRHYSKMYRKVVEMVRGGRIGNVTAARAQWNRNDEIRRPCHDPRLERLINWRLYREFSGGLMSEFATHQIDVINWILEAPPHSICAVGGRDYPGYNDGRTTSDNVHVIFTYMADWREFQEDENGEWKFEPTGQKYPVRFDYMSIMTNALLGPSEIIFGDEGAIEVTLAGGDFWKEAKVLRDPQKIKQGTDPSQTYQKKILKSGETITAVTKGRRPPDMEITIPRDKTDWTEFVGRLAGGHSPQETLLAVDDFLEQIRKARAGESFEVSADVKYGLWAAATGILANIALERRSHTVYWDEFFDSTT